MLNAPLRSRSSYLWADLAIKWTGNRNSFVYYRFSWRCHICYFFVRTIDDCANESEINDKWFVFLFCTTLGLDLSVWPAWQRHYATQLRIPEYSFLGVTALSSLAQLMIGTLFLLIPISVSYLPSPSHLYGLAEPWHPSGKGPRPLLGNYWRTEERYFHLLSGGLGSG